MRISDLSSDVCSSDLKLSRRTCRVCHLGVLEDGMMTYLIKEGDAQDHTLSRQGMQLEAYCTGLGKALLAHMPETERNDYLSSGTFVPLTPNTLTTPEALSAEFDRIRRSEEHTSELQSLMRISYAVFCLNKKNY